MSAVRKVEELEPLPNIDFNMMPGNSLIGLMHVDEHEFDAARQDDLFRKPLSPTTGDKNRLLGAYRNTAEQFAKDVDLRQLRDHIDAQKRDASALNERLLLDEFKAWESSMNRPTGTRQENGQTQKAPVDARRHGSAQPFHWGYVFDEIMQQRGGFDVILTNPPWEVFKPQAKEFFADHSDLVSKNKMAIKEFEKEQAKLLKDGAVREAWLAYESRFPHMMRVFPRAPEYPYPVGRWSAARKPAPTSISTSCSSSVASLVARRRPLRHRAFPAASTPT